MGPTMRIGGSGCGRMIPRVIGIAIQGTHSEPGGGAG